MKQDVELVGRHCSSDFSEPKISVRSSAFESFFFLNHCLSYHLLPVYFVMCNLKCSKANWIWASIVWTSLKEVKDAARGYHTK